MFGGDAGWARDIRRQLVFEIELVSGGMAGGQLPRHDTPVQADGRVADLRRRLEQVDRLIEAIDALRDTTEDEESNPVSPGIPVMADNAAIGRNGRSPETPLAD